MDSSWISADPVAVPSGRVARGRIRVPSSKSVTHRQLALALLSQREILVRNPLRAEDTDLFLGLLRGLGYRVEETIDAVRLVPPDRLPPTARFECGNAGTLLRLVIGCATVLPGRWTIDGSSRLRERPIGPLVEALRTLGARIVFDGAEGFAPVTVSGGRLAGGETEVDAGASSQYLSAVLLAGLGAEAPVSVRALALTSAPYVELTMAAIESWGGEVERVDDCYRVAPSRLARTEVDIEGDESAAAYPAAAAVVTGGAVEIEGLASSSRQGDRGFAEILGRMGARVDWEDGRRRVTAGVSLRGIGPVDLSAMPDQVPTLAAVAALADGPTRITGVAHLRIKECDRLQAMRTELVRLGFGVEETEDGLVLDGRPEPLPTEPTVVEAYDDHRIAMSLAIVGLRRPGVLVSTPSVVAKSYPSFWADLGSLIG